MPAAIALPMTVVASKPSNISGNNVTSSNVIGGASTSVIAVLVPAFVLPPHPHLPSRGVDAQHELRDQRNQPFMTVGVLHLRDVVRAVPDRARHDPERAPVLVLHG